MVANKKSADDYIISIIIFVFVAITLVTAIYPFLNSIAISFNNADDTTRGGITFFPRMFTLRNYELIFQNPKIYNAYFISIMRTVVGVITSLTVTGLLAYALSHQNLKFRKFYSIFFLVPMYFTGGLIPFYLLINNLGLTNTFWVYVIPTMVGLWNMILMRSYFENLPEALEESARIDGASYTIIFFRIIMPISTPIIATVALFIAVGQWNAWFDAAMYVTKQELKPMQSILMSIISEARFAEQMAVSGGSMGAMGTGKTVNVRSITMATMVVTILPIICSYPFLQKYFEKGIMVGSIKG